MSRLIKSKFLIAILDVEQNGKRCSCGKVHKQVPSDAKYHIDEFHKGIYWNCECNSTLVKVCDDKAE